MKYLDVAIYVVVALVTVIALFVMAFKGFMLLNKEAQRQAMAKSFKRYHKKLIKKERYEEASLSLEVLNQMEQDNYKQLYKFYHVDKDTSFKFKGGELSIIIDFTFELKENTI